MKGLKPEHRQYAIKHVPGQHLDLYERIILARDWNAAIEANSASLTDRSEINHFEMDTIVSGVGGKGGLLVLGDRKSRIGFIEKLEHINQESVAKALQRMKRDERLDRTKIVTTDNGSEFLDQALLEKILGCRFTTRMPTPLMRRERLRISIALCGAGIPKEPVSLALRARMR